MSKPPETSATWDGQPVKPTCGCGGHHTSGQRCQTCGGCPSVPHAPSCTAAHPEPASVRDLHDERQGGTSDA